MTKEQLRNYKHIKKEYARIEQRLRVLEKRPQREQDVLEPLRELYLLKLGDLARVQTRIENAINALEPIEREVIRSHYIDGLPWFRVAAGLNYSEPQVHRIHSNALQKLKNI